MSGFRDKRAGPLKAVEAWAVLERLNDGWSLRWASYDEVHHRGLKSGRLLLLREVKEPLSKLRRQSRLKERL